MPLLNPPPQKIPQSMMGDRDIYSFVRTLISSVYQIFSTLKEHNPSTTQNIVALTGIAVTNRIMRIQGSGGAVTISATPSIAVILDGYEVILQGDSDVNTVTLQDESNLASSGLALAGGADVTLGKGDTLHLIYDAGDGKWYEVSRSNN